MFDPVGSLCSCGSFLVCYLISYNLSLSYIVFSAPWTAFVFKLISSRGEGDIGNDLNP